MKYELIAKGAQMLTEVTNKPEKNVAEEINNFYTSPGMKATGYILGTIAVVGVIVVLAVVGYKAWSKRQARKYNNKY